MRRDDLARTLLESGEPAPIPPYPEFATHRWELGAGYGVYNRENLVTTYGDFCLTTSLDVEFAVQQAFGTLDNRYMATIGMRHTFIPEWKWFSPTAGIGTGLSVYPGQSATRSAAEEQRNGVRFAWGRADSSPGDFCGASTGAITSSSTT